MAHAPCHSDSFKRRLSYWCFWSFEKRPVKSYIELHLDLPPKRFTVSSPPGHSHSWILFTRFNLTQCYSYFTFSSHPPSMWCLKRCRSRHRQKS